MIFDVTQAEFETRVVERSRVTPVVVDFWAEWCRPCRALGPLLERATAAREGKVDLAKLDTDANQRLAAAFRIQSIPAVKAFRDGRVVDEFVGVVSADALERFFDRLVPSEADDLAASDDEAALRRALEIEPGHGAAAAKLARMLIARGEHDEAIALLEPIAGDFLAIGLASRARLERDGAGLGEAFAAWDAGDHERALELLSEALAAAGDEPDRRDAIREAMVGIFEELGPGHELARTFRRRLAATLY
jgi:putative thioredoxin